MRWRLVIGSLLLVVGCGGVRPRDTIDHGVRTWHASEPEGFNQLALRTNDPIYWTGDANGNGAPDPDEIRTLAFYATSDSVFVENGAFTPAFEEAARRIAEAEHATAPDRRRALELEELDHHRLTLIDTDARALPESDRTFIAHMLAAARAIDRAYARQSGMDALAPRLDASDRISASLFRSQWGARCSWSMVGDASCAPIEGAPRRLFDFYPPEIQDEHHAFCAGLREVVPLSRDPRYLVFRNADAASTSGAPFVFIPYATHYAELVAPVASELEAAASALTDPLDAAVAAHLRLAAGAFRDDAWQPVDDSWDELSAANGRWFVSLVPYGNILDPCEIHGAYRMVFGRYTRDADGWRAPLIARAPAMLAALQAAFPAGAPRERPTPTYDDVVQIVQAGDDRQWRGTAGDGSLQRTVAFTNAYTDDATHARWRAQASALFTTDVAPTYARPEERGLVSFVRHVERRWRFSAAFDDGAFVLAERAMMPLWLVGWLAEDGAIDETVERASYLHVITGLLRELSGGIVDRYGEPYLSARTAAIELGALVDAGVLRWDEHARSSDHAFEGAFVLDENRLRSGVRRAAEALVELLVTSDQAARDAMNARYVDGDALPLAAIGVRMNAPGWTSFVYSVEL